MFDRFGAHHYDLGSDKPEFVVYENEGGGLNANQTTISSLSDVAEALRSFSDLDVPLDLSGKIAKHTKSRTRFPDEPDDGREFRGNDQVNHRQ